jgi:hypothetical protein
MLNNKIKVYSAFPGCGKTTYYRTSGKNVLDSDSSTFDKKEFPKNYLKHIKYNLKNDTVDVILVSSHKEVRDALTSKGIRYVLVYPERELKDEYIQRYKDRGNNDGFINLLDNKWDIWMDEMDQQKGCYKVRLKTGQYLTDVIN